MGQLNKMTVTEGNRNFTKMLKNVDDEGYIYLTKNNKTKYVVLTKERFDKIMVNKENMDERLESGIYFHDGVGFRSIKKTDEGIVITGLLNSNDGTVIREVFSEDAVSITGSGNNYLVEITSWPESETKVSVDDVRAASEPTEVYQSDDYVEDPDDKDDDYFLGLKEDIIKDLIKKESLDSDISVEIIRKY